MVREVVVAVIAFGLEIQLHVDRDGDILIRCAFLNICNPRGDSLSRGRVSKVTLGNDSRKPRFVEVGFPLRMHSVRPVQGQIFWPRT